MELGITVKGRRAKVITVLLIIAIIILFVLLYGRIEWKKSMSMILYIIYFQN